MTNINSQAEELNRIIRKDNPQIFNLLSDKGRAIYFPKEGILAQAAEARGKKINATIGIAVEDDGTPMRLAAIAQKIALNPKQVFPYAPSFGVPELRKIWLEKMRQKNPSLKGKTSLPLVTNALTHGLSIVGYLFVNDGDSVILSDKFWGNYKLIFQNGYGAKIETFNTFKKGGFDTASLRQILEKDKGKKIIILNFPNNPTGYSPVKKEAYEIAKILKKHAEDGNEIIAVCDDGYFGLFYEKNIYPESLFSLLSDLHENILAVKVDGATKEDYVWGLRVGFITYAAKNITDNTCGALEAKTAGAIRGNISNASNLSQNLLLAAYTSPLYEKEKKQKYEILKARFKKVQKILKEKKFNQYFSPLPYNSGYFMCLELKKGFMAEKIRKLLLDKYYTGVISINNLLRLAFSSVAEKDLPQLFKNIYDACRETL